MKESEALARCFASHDLCWLDAEKPEEEKQEVKLNQDQLKLDYNSQLVELLDILKLENTLKELELVPQFILLLS